MTSSTHFGFETLSPDEKAKRVDDVFTTVSPVYDSMNDIMSLGLHRLWKRSALTALSLHPDHTVSDIACGSGDMSILIANKLTSGSLFCIDPNESMLQHCRYRLAKFHGTRFIVTSAEELALDTPLDRAIVSFGVRNFSNPELGLHNIYLSLKKGGKLVILEFNPPAATLFKISYPCYLKKCLPYLGKRFASSEKSYRYLAESIMMQPTPNERMKMLSDLGYQYITYSPLNFGIVGLFEAHRCL